MPRISGALRQFQARGLRTVALIEQTEFDLFRSFRINGKVHSGTIPRRAERIRASWQHPGLHSRFVRRKKTGTFILERFEKMFDLSGQTAIVTGAAQGIGEAIARRLAAAGATVAVADLNEEKAEQVAGSLGGKSFAVRLDVATPASVTQAVEEVLRRTGQIDVLVNNAGIAGRAAPLWEQTEEDWQRALAVNLSGVFYCCRAVIPHMRSRKYGRIVNIASIAGKEGNPRMVPYSATKAAVIALTKSLGRKRSLRKVFA